MKARAPECAACGEQTRRLARRDGRRCCADCLKLSGPKWDAAIDEAARLRAAEHAR